MPVLDRQPIAGRAPDRIPETAPTPLQRHYINLSAVALVAGALAITMVELGAPVSSTIVKLLVLVAAPILVLTTADAALRFWRSAWAWMAVDRGRGLFRISWAVTAVLGIVAVVAVAGLVLSA
jgi:hypothetical protein